MAILSGKIRRLLRDKPYFGTLRTRGKEEDYDFHGEGVWKRKLAVKERHGES